MNISSVAMGSEKKFVADASQIKTITFMAIMP
jgi:hypothetical protein